MKILVTGATGYVGSRLVPRLLEEGHEMRTTTTDASREGPWWSDSVETVEMDIGDDAQVSSAVEGMDAVYYLIHGMGGEDFVDKDRQAAERMAGAVDEHGVSRVVYLSGIVPPGDPVSLSDHITSRHEVEQILSRSSATALTLRAAVLVGSGSTSFEIVRQVSERMPVQTVPSWMDSRVQPIAVVDAVEALVGALTAEVETRSYDIGGPEPLHYAELLDRYAKVAGLERPQVEVPLVPTDLVGSLVGVITDVPAPTVEALVESLHHDMVCAEDDFLAELLPEGYALVGLDESLRRSLVEPSDEISADPAAADPMGPLPQDPSWANGGDGGSLAGRAAGAVRAIVDGVGGAAGRAAAG
ncbi:NAD(P)H-binding protein [Nostocoides sp. F2B08]|uniref:NAD(P)H-binding protein n=1 Tax=Nostocoides sp. F2B08 TaxID=2653936 RepID=UPI0012638A26|nr:NAD(P)H-binding protein [Tetrasphaera sp. F2B08]KAB7745353.1 NAD(P)H-binding protein [Tetrasphaera sp. F2B08]